MASVEHILDHNAFYSLKLDYDPSNQRLKVAVTDRGDPWARFTDNVTELLRIEQKGNVKNITREKRGRAGVFNNVSRGFKLYLGDECIGRYSINPKGDLTLQDRRPLTVDETRRIGNFYKCQPYAQRREGMSWEENQQLIETAKNAVFTDIHTHSTGQISARGLINAALHLDEPRYYYPLALLAEAGIHTDHDHIPRQWRAPVRRIPFSPREVPGMAYPEEVDGVDIKALFKKHPEDIDKLARRMSVRADRQSTFKHIEYEGNWFRNPLSKDPRLIRAIRQEEAAEYIAQDVKLALSSFVGIDNPHIFRTLHEVAIEAETKHPQFQQRFMIGIPRNLSQPQMQEALERAKIMLDSPYVVGVDILGYEVTKTREFIEALDTFMAWANTHKPGCFIRVHAGENDKNHDNVKDYLKAALKHRHLHYFVGHGVYGMDEETTRMAQELCKRKQLTLEFNPSSNIALNNVNDVRQIPFQTAMDHGLEFVVGSDSAGMYHTDATQLGLAAYYAGLDTNGFEKLRAHQDRVIEKVTAYTKRVAESITGSATPEHRMQHVEAILQTLAQRPKVSAAAAPEISEAEIKAKLDTDQVSLVESGQLPAELNGKVPITIIGASGDSWKRLTPAQQRENAIAVDMLIHALGDNCYVMQGRNKRKEGLCKVINKALSNTNKARKKQRHPEVFNVGMLVGPSFELQDDYRHLSHMIHVVGNKLDLADTIVDHTFDHVGVLVAVGGAAYTADIITEADQRGIHAKHPDNHKMMLLMRQGGASEDKAIHLHPDYGVMDGKQLVKKLFDQRRDLFPHDFTAAKLNELHHASCERVDTYRYNETDSTKIQGPAALAQQKRMKSFVAP